MRYQDLHELVACSNSSRQYFLSLPVSMQLQLQEHRAYIHSAADLHIRVSQIEKYNSYMGIHSDAKI